MPLWLADQPLVLASRSDVRGKMLAAAGLRFEIRPAQIDERARGSARPAAGCGGGGAPAGARQGRSGGGHAARPAGAGRRPDAGARGNGASASRPTAPTPPSSCARLRGRTHELHSALALVRDGEVLFAHVDTARLTMRDFSDDFLDNIST